MKQRKKLMIIFSLMLFCTAVVCCAVKEGKVFEKDGKQYGVVDGLFKEKWNDYYLRGVSYADGGFWTEAAADFQESLKQRSRDQRRARTYGLHFMDYFPRRELGIAWYHLGKIQEAITLLEASLNDIETARAKYYLNKARRQWLEEARADTLAPVVSLQSPSQTCITNKFAVTVVCSARDDSFVSRVSINEKSLPLELAQKEVSITEEVPLRNGMNRILLRAEDIMGKASDPVTLSVQVDREGPLVFLEATEDSGGMITVSGSVYDRYSVAKLKLHNRTIPLNRTNLMSIDEQFSRAQIAGVLKIPFIAEDGAGNATSGFIDITLPQHALFRQAPYRIASASLTGMTPQRKCTGAAGQAAALASAAMETPDASGRESSIELKGLRDGQTVFIDTLFIEGRAFAPGGVKDISVNGMSILNADSDASLAALLQELTKRQKKSLAFSRLVSLNEGANRITISLTDAAGATIKKEITIYRKIPAARQIGSRLSMAIYPFQEIKKTGEPLAAYVQTLLTSAFVNQQRFNILERNELSKVLEEQRISQEEIFDQKTAVRLGRMMAAETILLGDIAATETTLEIVARLVDTETSVILAEKDVYLEGKGRAEVRELLEGLGIKFKQHFPLCEGMILRRTSDQVIINLGKADAISEGMRFLVFQEGEAIIHPVTGENLGTDTEIIGLVSAREINDKFLKGNILKTFAQKEITEKVKVITK